MHKATVGNIAEQTNGSIECRCSKCIQDAETGWASRGYNTIARYGVLKYHLASCEEVVDSSLKECFKYKLRSLKISWYNILKNDYVLNFSTIMLFTPQRARKVTRRHLYLLDYITRKKNGSETDWQVMSIRDRLFHYWQTFTLLLCLILYKYNNKVALNIVVY